MWCCFGVTKRHERQVVHVVANALALADVVSKLKVMQLTHCKSVVLLVLLVWTDVCAAVRWVQVHSHRATVAAPSRDLFEV